MSVSGSSSAYLIKSSGLPSASGSWTWHIWVKAAGYPAGVVIAYNKTGGSDQYSGVDGGGTTIYNAYADDTVSGLGANAPIITGSYTGWTFVACRHVGGTTAYDFFVRKEGDTVLTKSTVDPAVELTLLNVLSLFSDGFGSGGAATAKAFVVLASAPSDASMLTRSQSLTDPGSTHTFLALNTAATATTNTGSGGSWSSSGTLTDGASDPNPSITPGQISAALTASASITGLLSSGGIITASLTGGATISSAALNNGIVPVYRINAGGGAVSPFATDQYYGSGSATSATGSAQNVTATNAAPQAVYQSERYYNGGLSYTFPSLTPARSYITRLHFAEIYAPNFSAGARRFNVSIQGSSVLTNFDIYATAGNSGDKAVVQDFTAAADGSGNLAIVFTPGTADNPKISGIEILDPSGNSSNLAAALTAGATVAGALGGRGTLAASLTASAAIGGSIGGGKVSLMGFKSAFVLPLPAQFALPVGYFAGPLQLAGLKLASPAIPMFQARRIAKSSTLATSLTAGASVAGSLTGRGALATSLTASATVAGGFSGQDTLTASLAGGATVSGSLGAVNLAAVLAAGATCAGSLDGRGALAASLTGGGSVAGAMGADNLSAALTAGSTCGGTLVGRGALAASLTGSGSVTGSLGAINLAAVLTAGASCAGALGGLAGLSSALTGSASVAGSLGASSGFTAILTASASCTGTLSATGALTAGLAGGAAATGLLGATGALSSNLNAGAICSGALGAIGALASMLTGGATCAGSLAGRGSLATALGGSASVGGLLLNGSSQSASLSAGATCSGTLTGRGALLATLGAGAVTTGSLTSPGPLTASLSAGASCAGTVLGSSALASVLSCGASCAGTLTGRGTVSTVLVASASCTGSLTNLPVLASSLTCSASVVAALGGRAALLASLTAGASFSAAASRSLQASLFCSASIGGVVYGEPPPPFTPASTRWCSPVGDMRSAAYVTSPINLRGALNFPEAA